MHAGANQLLSVGSAHSALPSDVSLRAVSCLAIRQQTFWRKHGGHHGCGETQLTSTLSRDPREGSFCTTNTYVPTLEDFYVLKLGLSR